MATPRAPRALAEQPALMDMGPVVDRIEDSAAAPLAARMRPRTLDEVAAWPDRIGAVTPAEVAAAARAVLVERNSATGILLPERTS